MKKGIAGIVFGVMLLIITGIAFQNGALAASSGVCGDDITWDLDDDGLLTITGTGEMYDGNNTSLFPTDLVKKAVINKGVTTIGNNAFRGCGQLLSVTIPNTVSYVGMRAFQDCPQLIRAVLPNSVTSTGSHVFYNCTGLKSVTLPSGLKTLPKSALYGCTSLESITWPSALETIGEYALGGCTGLTAIVIPSTVGTIKDYAFTGCSGLTQIDIPGSVQTIGAYAFSSCKGLRSVTFHTGLREIGAYAFNSCSGLNYFDFPEGTTTIGDGAFQSCGGRCTLVIPNSVTSIGKSLCFNPYVNGHTIKARCDSYAYQYRQSRDGVYSGWTGGNYPYEGYSVSYRYGFESTGHIEQTTVTKTPTCYETGLSTTKCTICGAVIAENTVLPIVDHDPISNQDGYDPTCTETGLTDSTSCLYCGMEMSRQEVIPALGHDWGEAGYEWSGDNTEVTASHVCKRDDTHTETETVRTTYVQTKDPTCEEYGDNTYTAVFTTDGFSRQEKTVTEVEPLGHDWGQTTYTWTADNSKVTALRYCNRNRTHIELETAQTKSTTTATCEEDGETTFTTDPYDNPAFEIQSKTVPGTPALGHDWDTPSYIWSNDYGTVVAIRVCKNDPSHTEDEVAVAEAEVTTPATCTEMGKTTYTAAFSNEAFPPQSVTLTNVPATGHRWGQPVYSWAEDNSTVTAARICENDHEHTETETAEVVSETTTPATCLSTGKTTYTASFGNQAFTTQTKTLTDIPALGHRWGNPVYTWESDNSAVTAVRICENDPQHTESETAAVNAEITTPATCTEMGKTTYTAVFENDVFTVQEKTVTDVLPTGHEWSSPVYTWAEDNKTVTAARVCVHDDSHVETETANVTSRITTPATCYNMGKTTYTASFSNDAFSTQTKTLTNIPPTGHSWMDPGYTWAADNSQVTAVRVCANDSGHTESETAAVTSQITTPATCTAMGKTTYTARFENPVFETQTKVLQNIPALGHRTVTDAAVPPACTETGLTEGSHCSVCHTVFVPQQVIPATGHTLVKVAKELPTCTETGTEAYWYCSVCGALFGDQYGQTAITAPGIIPAEGHRWNAPSYTWAPDYSSVTAKRVCAKDDTHQETETAAAVSSVTRPSAGEAGTAVYAARFNHSAFRPQKKTVSIPALNHLDVFTLPAMLKAVGEEAFEGIGSQAVILPDGCVSVGRKAFADSPNLRYAWIPESVKYVDPTAFDGCEEIVLDYEGRSGAEKFPVLNISTNASVFDYGETVVLTASIAYPDGTTEGLAARYPGARISAKLITSGGAAADGFTDQTGSGLNAEFRFTLRNDSLEAGNYRILVWTGVENWQLETEEFYYTARRPLPSECNVRLSLNGSRFGFNDELQMTAYVTDKHGNPAQGIPVGFRITGPDGEEVRRLPGETDDNGIRICTIAVDSGYGLGTGACLARAWIEGGSAEDTQPFDYIRANLINSEIAVDETNFPDPMFRDYVRMNADTSGNGALSGKEIAAVTEMNISELEIETIQGIEFFSSLQDLNCWYNYISSVDFSQNTALKYLCLDACELSTLDLSHNTELLELYLASNYLTSLDVSKCTGLKKLYCQYNLLDTLNLSQNTKLKELCCQGNIFTSVNVSKCTALTKLVKNTTRKNIKEDDCSDWGEMSGADGFLRVDRDVTVIAGSTTSKPKLSKLTVTDDNCTWIQNLFGLSIEAANSLLTDKLTANEEFYSNEWFGVELDYRGRICTIYVFDGTKYSLFNIRIGGKLPSAMASATGGWVGATSNVYETLYISEEYPYRAIMLSLDSGNRITGVVYGWYDPSDLPPEPTPAPSYETLYLNASASIRVPSTFVLRKTETLSGNRFRKTYEDTVTELKALREKAPFTMLVTELPTATFQQLLSVLEDTWGNVETRTINGRGVIIHKTAKHDIVDYWTISLAFLSKNNIPLRIDFPVIYNIEMDMVENIINSIKVSN